MKLSKLNQSVIATIFVFAFGAPIVASADDESDIQGKAVKVSYADLDLNKSEGAKTLYRRLQNASREACDMRAPKDEGSARRVTEAKKCYRIALTAAVEDVDNELLTQIHNN